MLEEHKPRQFLLGNISVWDTKQSIVIISVNNEHKLTFISMRNPIDYIWMVW